MHTPSAALAWEFWRRHRMRLMTMLGLFLGFVLLYPGLCSLVGLSFDGSDALDAVAHVMGPLNRPPSASQILRILYVLALACGPVGTMFMSLLCLTWMFTLTAVDSKTKDPMAFPARLFTLPVSTPFLFWWIFLTGQL